MRDHLHHLGVPLMGIGPAGDLVQVRADPCQLPGALPLDFGGGCGPGARSGRELARWPIRTPACPYPGFPPSCPFSRVRGSVSSSRHLARSMKISFTTRSCTLRDKIYGTYRSEPFSPSATPPLLTEASARRQGRSAFLLPYTPDLRSCRLLDAFIISPLPHCC